MPPNIQVSLIGPDQTLAQMLHTGALDVLYAARIPSSFFEGDGEVKSLFENHGEIEGARYPQTKIYPPCRPWLNDHIDQTMREMGDGWWSCGHDKNRHVLETFSRHHLEQGLSQRQLTVADLFASASLESFKI